MAKVGPKKYGLIIQAKKGTAAPSIKKPSAFDDSSSDEEERGGKGISSSSLWRENKKNAKKIKSRASVVKALEEDPNVFEYDTLYDKIQDEKKKADPRLVKKDKSSKYIGHLKKVAERRKLEQEIIYERKVQREMEQEGKEYGDKDTFLTSAYRKKLEERRELEEELKIEAQREKADSVTKQEDLSRFHRNLLDDLTRHGPSGKDSREDSGGQRDRKDSRESGESRQGDRERSEHEDMMEERDTENPGQSSEGTGQDLVTSEQTSEGVEWDSGQSSMKEEKDSNGRQDEPEEPEGKDSMSLFPPVVDKEKRRKEASAKRTNEESLSSAKERYLARKRAKISTPIISDD